uniref:NADH-ubiquinone oxidoreductase chain 6 n=1 Tax=Lymantria monacha TaxID=78897 RepID=A0A385I790_9NEOP|nr:NADH dehydrogenase subunit 6 [Lymantria monacha]
MLLMMLSMLICVISFLMLYLNNPLSMGLMILFQTMLICLMSGMLIKTYWFSYILFLIFLGGLLVLFIYVSSIASNELFLTSYKMKTFFLMSLMLISIMMIMYMYNEILVMNTLMNSDMINFYNLKTLIIDNNFNKMNLNKLYNNQTYMLMWMLVIYLFITLIAVVKITNIFYGPLRSKF